MNPDSRNRPDPDPALVVNIQHMDIHEGGMMGDDDQVVPGSSGDHEDRRDVKGSPPVERRVPHPQTSTPLAFLSRRSDMDLHPQSNPSSLQGSVGRDSGYVSTPTSGTHTSTDQHFFSEADIDGSYLQRYSGNLTDETQDDDTDGNVVKQSNNPENPNPNAITEEDSDNDIQTDEAPDYDTEEQAVFFIEDGNAFPSSINPSNSIGDSVGVVVAQQDSSRRSSSNIGDATTEQYSTHSAFQQAHLLGNSSNVTTNTSRLRRHGVLGNTRPNSNVNSNASSPPMMIPNMGGATGWNRHNQLQRSHQNTNHPFFFLGNSGNQSNVYHTPPRGYMVDNRAGGDSNRAGISGISSSGADGSTEAFGGARRRILSMPTFSSVATQQPLDPSNAEHLSQQQQQLFSQMVSRTQQQAHQQLLAQNRHMLLNDDANPRRSRHFSEHVFDEQQEENSDPSSHHHVANGGVNGLVDGELAPMRRDRSLSAPAIMSMEKEFGREMRRIADVFDQEYSQSGAMAGQAEQIGMRHGRNSDNRRSFPGTEQRDAGWWEKIIQWLPINPEHGRNMTSHRTEPLLHTLGQVDEYDEEDDSSKASTAGGGEYEDEVDGIFPPPEYNY